MTRSPFDQYSRGSSDAARKKCVAYWGLRNGLGRIVMVCQGEGCGVFVEAMRSKDWDADHQITIAEGGADECPNIRPLCKECHSKKTFTQDIPRIAKEKRTRDKHFGVKRRKFKWPSRPFNRGAE